MRRLTIPLASLAAALALLLVFSAAVEKFTHRDEHQFVVPGLQTARQGLVPYRDYPLFHMPYLVLLHGAAGAATGWPLLTARIVTATTAWLSLLLIGAYAWRRIPEGSKWRLPLSIALPALWLFQPIFGGTVTYAWNHSAPVFCVLVGFFLYVLAAQSARPLWLVMGAGASLAMAACMRLTFLPLFAPFAIAFLFFPERNWRDRVFLLGAFALAVLVIAIPALYLFAIAPEQFLFGNLGYPKLSVTWRRHPIWQEDLHRFVDPIRGFLDPLHEGLHGRALERKLRKAVSVTFVANWPLFVAFASALTGVAAAIRTRTFAFPLLLLGLVLPFAWWGCVAPSRFHVQYFFALTPFLLVAWVELYQTAAAWPSLARTLGIVLLTLAMISIGAGFAQYAFVRDLGHFEKWGPVIAHRMAFRFRAAAPSGRVLTLAPLVVEEGGLPTYPELSSGEFGWRTAHLLSLEKRRRLHLVCPFDLEPWLEKDTPGSILLETTEEPLQTSLKAWANDHDYERVRTDGIFELWRRLPAR